METKILPTSDPSAIDQALAVLKAGGLVAIPTDTVYGLAGLAFNPESIDRIYLAKGRDSAKAIPILVGDLDQLAQVTSALTPSASRLAAHFWPGALTLIVPGHPSLPANLSQTPTVGVRMPDHSFTLSLLRRSGPLAVSSANISGGENSSTALDVFNQLNGKIELILDGGVAPGGIPSTVVDCTANQARILREGGVQAQAINALLSIG